MPAATLEGQMRVALRRASAQRDLMRERRIMAELGRSRPVAEIARHEGVEPAFVRLVRAAHSG